MDEITANLVMFAVATYAGDREAHAREVDRFGQALPEGSYGRQNREAIAARELSAARRLRGVERAYQRAIGYDAAMIDDSASAVPMAYTVADRELELE